MAMIAIHVIQGQAHSCIEAKPGPPGPTGVEPVGLLIPDGSWVAPGLTPVGACVVAVPPLIVDPVPPGGF